MARVQALDSQQRTGRTQVRASKTIKSTLALGTFEQAVHESHAGTVAHVGARADLKAVTDEIMHLVRQLDAIQLGDGAVQDTKGKRRAASQSR